MNFVYVYHGKSLLILKEGFAEYSDLDGQLFSSRA